MGEKGVCREGEKIEEFFFCSIIELLSLDSAVVFFFFFFFFFFQNLKNKKVWHSQYTFSLIV